ncbi:hypothetical protein AMS68_005396 [Peltaster fructicola]|uniref:Glycerol-3-phosphate dehydrogenase [NAD(+)] n=1 Tax=Peltaster fructicola TaxID=286661 RepID=A0A6H0XZ41_9PEZI|nr:hypothetical protein AMS68_005396 [Peltaster fructicola]
MAHTRKHKIAVVGSGNWGTTICKVVAENVKEHADLFEEEVQMWVFEEDCTLPKDSKHAASHPEMLNKPQKLSKLINELHENVKYLPDIPLPRNIIANPDSADAVKDATILIFNMPHQFFGKICEGLRGKVLPYARGISCIKGVSVSAERGCELFSNTIAEKLGIYCGALSGANIATEIAMGKWSETTVAYDAPPVDNQGPGAKPFEYYLTGSDKHITLQPMPSEYPLITHENLLKLFYRPYLHVRVIGDVAGTSLGGALKNVVALAAGFVDGLGWGDNAKAAVMRVGIQEEVKFGEKFFADTFKVETITEESCGVADMITSCMGGRNFRCAKMATAEKKPIGEIEKRELNGQKLQGTDTAYEVNAFLKSRGMEKDFPLFTAVYNILEGNNKPEDIPQLLAGQL